MSDRSVHEVSPRKLACLLEGLNDPQREAVLHIDGPLLVLAGPGSGKTRVITRRAAYLATTAARPWQILAITFTNKASREMQERVAQLEGGRGVIVSTFHALCARMLREFHDRAGLPKGYSILDRDDRRKVLKEAIARCDLPEQNWSAAKVDPIIGRAKNAMISASDYANRASDWMERTAARIYTAYEAILTETGSLDFDDLLMRMAILLHQDAEVLARLQDRFRYVLIDEYQDTNVAQYTIARVIAQAHENICATGDPDQSIYGWRGADISNILSFERDYPGAKVVRLEENYRSTQRILAVADKLIGFNLQRKPKSLWTRNDPGGKVRIVECEDGDEESAMVCADITRAIAAGANPGDIAVLYRINSLSRSMEESLLRSGITYQVARGVEFYNRKEIKDVLAYLRVICNPLDEVALLRIINTPARGIGDTTVDRLRCEARRSGVGLTALIQDADRCAEVVGRASPKIRRFAELLALLQKAKDVAPHEALEFIVSQSGLRALYAAESHDESSPIANIDELISAAAEFCERDADVTIQDWLEHIALLSDVDSVRDGKGAVTLMTLHAAKGLEFDIAYILGLEEGLLPFVRHGGDPSDIEEERRLAFVGITRARKELTLSFVRYRMLRGISSRTVSSPFLDELPEEAVEWIGPSKSLKSTDPSRVAGSLPDDFDDWGVGAHVEHPLHGLGVIIGMTQLNRRTQLDILFRRGGRRSMILEFAQLTRVDASDLE